MDVRVDAAWRQNFAFARDDVGAGADDDAHIRLNVRISRLADRRDAAILDSDIGFDDAPMIQNDDIGDHHISDFGCETLALAHAVADHLAATESDFVAIDRVVFLDLDDQFRIGKPNPVAFGRAVEIGIVLRVQSLPSQLSSLPITLR